MQHFDRVAGIAAVVLSAAVLAACSGLLPPPAVAAVPRRNPRPLIRL